MTRRALIASEFNARDKAHFALSYEFCRIIDECDDVDVLAPPIDNYLERWFSKILPPHDNHNVQRDFNRLTNGMRKSVGLRNAPTMSRSRLEQNYELFLFVAWSAQSLVELSRIKNWRSRCKIAVVYLFEQWTSTLEQDKPYLKMLDQFDHVFLLHSACIPRMAAYTRTPCSWLPTGVDCLIASPYPNPPERVVDVYSIGNRSAALHQQTVALAERRDLLYIYDSLSSTDSRVKDWREHRLLLANIIKRSRYFIGFNPASLANAKSRKIAGEQVLPSRLFEGAAGGAVILGSAPRCPEFDECFDWPDAVIEISPDRGDIAAIIDDLEGQPGRIERLRRTSATRCLERHDWVYRWERILSAVGMAPLPQLRERKSQLKAIAAAAMSLEPA